MIEQLLAQRGRKVGLGVVQKGSDVVLQGSLAAALIIEEIGLAVAQHDVAGLEIAIEKIIAGGVQQELGQASEVDFEGLLLVERHAGEAEKIVFEVVEVPGDGLAIEAAARIADFVVQVASGFDLKAGQHGHDLAIGFDHMRRDVLALAIPGEEFEKRGVAEVFFQIGALV